MKRLLLLIGLMLLPAICEAQGVTSPYLQLVWRYRAGDTRGAVAAAAALPTRGLRERVLRDLGSHICDTIAGERDCETVRERQRETWRSRVVPLLRVAMPAAVLLHLHVATVLEFAGAREEGLAHRRLVAILLDRMTRVESDLEPAEAAAFRDIRRRAHLLVTWLLQSDLAVSEADETVRDGLRAFPEDPDLLLGCGWVEETWGRPAVSGSAIRAAIVPGEPRRRPHGMAHPRANLPAGARRRLLSSQPGGEPGAGRGARAPGPGALAPEPSGGGASRVHCDQSGRRAAPSLSRGALRRRHGRSRRQLGSGETLVTRPLCGSGPATRRRALRSDGCCSVTAIAPARPR